MITVGFIHVLCRVPSSVFKVWVVIQPDITSARRVLFNTSDALLWSDLKHLGARLFIIRSSREIYPVYWVLINVPKVKVSLNREHRADLGRTE